jgi:hypothetical protein
MTPPMVKRHTAPRSGFCPVCRCLRPGGVGLWPRVPTCVPSASADGTWRRHTCMEARAPSRRRWQGDLRGCCGLELCLDPPTLPPPSGGGRVTVHSCAAGAGAGQPPVLRWRPSPTRQKPERAANQHGRAQGIRPMRAFAVTDAVSPCVQRAIPALSREASGAPAPTPRAVATCGPLERRVAS